MHSIWLTWSERAEGGRRGALSSPALRVRGFWTSGDKPICGSSCSSPAEDYLQRGRLGSHQRQFRTEIAKRTRGWTNSRAIRDREAPGSNPGPPTSFLIRTGHRNRSLRDNAAVLV